MSFLWAQFAPMAFATGWFCVLAAAALLWHRAAVSGSRQAPAWFTSRLQQLHAEQLFEEFELIVAFVLAFLAFYFLLRGCERCRPGSYFRIVVDELIGASAFVLMMFSTIVLNPIGKAVALLDQEIDLGNLDPATSKKLSSAHLALSQLLLLWMLAAVPLRSSIWALVLLSSGALSLLSDEDGFAFRLVCIALPFMYLISRNKEILSRQNFKHWWLSEDLAINLKEKESEAKSNMTLARGMQSLAGRRSDMVLILTARLEVWRSTALQDLFFKQDMDGCSFLDILPPHEHELFLTTARRVREHKAGESLPLTLPRGYAKIILEYAGNEDDRYVMSILLDESADEAFRHDQCAPLRISSSKGYDPSRKFESSSDAGSSTRMRQSLLKVMEGDEDSLCYSASLMKSVEETESLSDVGTNTTFRDFGSDMELRRRVKGRDCEVQVNLLSFNSLTQSTQTDMHYQRDEVVCLQCTRARPPRPPSELMPMRKHRRRSRSSSKGSSSAEENDASGEPAERSEGSRSNPSTPPPALLEACGKLGLLRLTAPRWPTTRPACITTSIAWLMKHWNFSYLTVQCCPFHAALGVALQTLKTQKKDSCNPLWSPFTGWQCDFCTAMNHKNSELCDLCGSSRTSGDQSFDTSMTLSQTTTAKSSLHTNSGHELSLSDGACGQLECNGI